MTENKNANSDQNNLEENLDRIEIVRRSGNEPFRHEGSPLGFDLLSFWQWSFSDIVSNATRGILAEYIVARAIGVSDDNIRDEWAPYDLKTSSGARIEVKSAAYIQTWKQSRFSGIGFGVGKTRALIEGTNFYNPVTKRQADVYVFAVLVHKDKETLDPLNLSQWEFYVLPTYVLDDRQRSQHSISLNSLGKILGGHVVFRDLKDAIEESYIEQKKLPGERDTTLFKVD